MKSDTEQDMDDIPPPGIIRASHLLRSSGVRTRTTSILILNVNLSKTVLCSAKAPWRALTENFQRYYIAMH